VHVAITLQLIDSNAAMHDNNSANSGMKPTQTGTATISRLHRAMVYTGEHATNYDDSYRLAVDQSVLVKC
jgi:hypothetical protein